MKKSEEEKIPNSGQQQPAPENSVPTDIQKPVSAVESPDSQQKPEVEPTPPQPKNSSVSTENIAFAKDADKWIVIGASVTGNGHISTGCPCQDSHKYEYLGDGWGIAVVSDGAGSAGNSHFGSKIVVERAVTHFKEIIISRNWITKIVEIMTVITFLILIAFAIFVTCLFTKVPWNVILFDIGIGGFVLGLSVWVWGWNYDKTFLLLPVGFIISLIMYSGIGLFSFIAMNKMLDIAVNILTVLWIIVGYKCYYDNNRNRKHNNAIKISQILEEYGRTK